MMPVTYTSKPGPNWRNMEEDESNQFNYKNSGKPVSVMYAEWTKKCGQQILAWQWREENERNTSITRNLRKTDQNAAEIKRREVLTRSKAK